MHRRKLVLLAIALAVLALLGTSVVSLIQLNAWQRENIETLRLGTWFMLQAQAHMARLTVLLHRFEREPAAVDPDELKTQFEIFWSRVDVLSSNEVAGFFVRQKNLQPTIERWIDTLKQLDPIVAGLDATHRTGIDEAIRRIEAIDLEIGALSLDMNKRRVASMQETYASGEARFLYFLYSVLGVAAAGVVLVLMLFRALSRQEQHLRASRDAEHRAAGAERDLRAVVDALPLMVTAADRNGQLILVNRFCAEFIGVPAERALGSWPEEVGDDWLARPPRAPAGERPVFGEEQVTDGQGRPHTLLATAVAIVDAQGVLDRTVNIALDITDRKAAEDRATYLARHDELTSLPNRASLIAWLERELSAAPDEPLCLFLIDLDDFRHVNDALGHAFGDLVLQEFARRFELVLDGTGAAFRLGADEFAACCRLDDAGPVEVAQRMKRVLDRPVIVGSQPVAISTSVGIAMAPLHGDDPETLLRHADAALSAIKGAGRSLVQLFDAKLEDELRYRRIVEQELRQAVAKRSLTVHFQPKWALADGALAGFEALVRWEHPSLGQVSPGLFIPIAEHAGIIVELGRHVIEQTCEQLRRWQGEGRRLLPVAVNISAAQLMHGDVVTTIEVSLARTGIEAEMLQVEVTESLLMRDPDRAIRVLSELRERGIQVAIDDFGTGFSSLSYLQRLPFDSLKIDRSFVIAIEQPGPGEAIVRSIVDLATNLGAKVIAEGIENPTQLEALVAAGCHEGQGYLLGQPCSPQVAGDLLPPWEPSAMPYGEAMAEDDDPAGGAPAGARLTDGPQGAGARAAAALMGVGLAQPA